MKVEIMKCRPKMKYPILAWFIMLFQGMKPWKKDSWSHMAMCCHGIVFHMTGDGFQRDVNLDFYNKYRVLDSADIEVDPHKFAKFIKEQKGKKYDRLQIFGLMLKALGFVSFNTIGHNYRKLICSELILNMIFEVFGFNAGDPDDYDLLMTWKLVKELECSN